MKEQTTKNGRIAFITTPKFRTSSPTRLKTFVYAHLYELCASFEVITTGRTYTKGILPIIKSTPNAADRRMIRSGMGLAQLNNHDLRRWRRTITNSLQPTTDSFQGMIQVIFELVEGRLDAVIHFTDWEDKSAKADSAVLSREANVHDVPIATDPDTAHAHIRTWKRRLISGGAFKAREPMRSPPLEGLEPTHRVLAIIAHDNMKLETCRFAVEHARHIFDSYDFVLATGTTGGWIKRFMEAAGRGASEVDRIRLCNSGPKGGDIQIAYAVVKGICHKIIFLQDPTVSHPHDSDIRLFEQAVLAEDVHVELATNVESARLLIGV